MSSQSSVTDYSRPMGRTTPVSDRLVRPTASNVAATRELFERRTTHPPQKNINDESVKPVSESLLRPTAASIYAQQQRLEQLDDVNSQEDIWWNQRSNPKNEALNKVPDLYEHVAPRWQAKTTAYTMQTAGQRQAELESQNKNIYVRPIQTESRLLVPTAASLYNVHRTPLIDETKASNPVNNSEAQRQSPTQPMSKFSNMYKDVKSKLNHTTKAILRSAYKSKEEKAMEEEVRREVENEERGGIKVKETSAHLLVPTASLELRRHAYLSAVGGEKGAVPKPVTSDQSKTPQEVHKVKETPKHLLIPTQATENGIYVPPQPAKPIKIPSRDVPVSDSLLEPTAAIIHAQEALMNQPEVPKDPREKGWNNIVSVKNLARLFSAPFPAPFPRTNSSSTKSSIPGTPKSYGSAISTTVSPRLMVPTASQEYARYVPQSAKPAKPVAVDTRPVPESLLKPTLSQEYGRYTPQYVAAMKQTYLSPKSRSSFAGKRNSSPRNSNSSPKKEKAVVSSLEVPTTAALLNRYVPPEERKRQEEERKRQIEDERIAREYKSEFGAVKHVAAVDFNYTPPVHPSEKPKPLHDSPKVVSKKSTTPEISVPGTPIERKLSVVVVNSPRDSDIGTDGLKKSSTPKKKKKSPKKKYPVELYTPIEIAVNTSSKYSQNPETVPELPSPGKDKVQPISTIDFAALANRIITTTDKELEDVTDEDSVGFEDAVTGHDEEVVMSVHVPLVDFPSKSIAKEDVVEIAVEKISIVEVSRGDGGDVVLETVPPSVEAQPTSDMLVVEEEPIKVDDVPALDETVPPVQEEEVEIIEEEIIVIRESIVEERFNQKPHESEAAIPVPVIEEIVEESFAGGECVDDPTPAVESVVENTAKASDSEHEVELSYDTYDSDAEPEARDVTEAVREPDISDLLSESQGDASVAVELTQIIIEETQSQSETVTDETEAVVLNEPVEVAAENQRLQAEAVVEEVIVTQPLSEPVIAKVPQETESILVAESVIVENVVTQLPESEAVIKSDTQSAPETIEALALPPVADLVIDAPQLEIQSEPAVEDAASKDFPEGSHQSELVADTQRGAEARAEAETQLTEPEIVEGLILQLESEAVNDPKPSEQISLVSSLEVVEPHTESVDLETDQVKDVTLSSGAVNLETVEQIAFESDASVSVEVAVEVSKDAALIEALSESVEMPAQEPLIVEQVVDVAADKPLPEVIKETEASETVIGELPVEAHVEVAATIEAEVVGCSDRESIVEPSSLEPSEASAVEPPVLEQVFADVAEKKEAAVETSDMASVEVPVQSVIEEVKEPESTSAPEQLPSESVAIERKPSMTQEQANELSSDEILERTLAEATELIKGLSIDKSFEPTEESKEPVLVPTVEPVKKSLVDMYALLNPKPAKVEQGFSYEDSMGPEVEFMRMERMPVGMSMKKKSLTGVPGSTVPDLAPFTPPKDASDSQSSSRKTSPESKTESLSSSTKSSSYVSPLSIRTRSTGSNRSTQYVGRFVC